MNEQELLKLYNDDSIDINEKINRLNDEIEKTEDLEQISNMSLIIEALGIELFSR